MNVIKQMNSKINNIKRAQDKNGKPITYIGVPLQRWREFVMIFNEDLRDDKKQPKHSMFIDY